MRMFSVKVVMTAGKGYRLLLSLLPDEEKISLHLSSHWNTGFKKKKREKSSCYGLKSVCGNMRHKVSWASLGPLSCMSFSCAEVGLKQKLSMQRPIFICFNSVIFI